MKNLRLNVYLKTAEAKLLVGKLAQVFAPVAGGIIIYIGAAFALKMEEATTLLAASRR